MTLLRLPRASEPSLPDAIDDNGVLSEQFHGSDKGRKYLGSPGPGRRRQSQPGRCRGCDLQSPPHFLQSLLRRRATSSPSDATPATTATSSPTTGRRSIFTGPTATSTTSRATSTSATTTGRPLTGVSVSLPAHPRRCGAEQRQGRRAGSLYPALLETAVGHHRQRDHGPLRVPAPVGE